MSTNFAIIGGDLRMIKLARMLANDEKKVYIYGLEKAEELENIKNIIHCINFELVTQNTKIIIAPTPFSKNGKDITTQFSDTTITIQELMSACHNKTLIAGAIKPEIYELAKNKNVKIIDIMEKEELAILNAISTAEGAIKIAIENTDKILHGSNILILGFGRIAKVLAKKLEGLSAKVTCAARKKEDLAWIEAYGYNKTNINNLGENLSKYDIIMNTVPHIILTKDKLQYIKKECQIIELASSPGGVDKIVAEENGIKVIPALALPGKVAPVTSAKIIKDVVYDILKERS